MYPIVQSLSFSLQRSSTAHSPFQPGHVSAVSASLPPWHSSWPLPSLNLALMRSNLKSPTHSPYVRIRSHVFHNPPTSNTLQLSGYNTKDLIHYSPTNIQIHSFAYPRGVYTIPFSLFSRFCQPDHSLTVYPSLPRLSLKKQGPDEYLTRTHKSPFMPTIPSHHPYPSRHAGTPRHATPSIIHVVLNFKLSLTPSSFRAPITPTMTDISSFFPPTKSIPSAAARSMNGVSEFKSSDFCLAARQRVSDTFCGSNSGRCREEVADVVVVDVEEGGANSSRHSTISSSNCIVSE